MSRGSGFWLPFLSRGEGFCTQWLSRRGVPPFKSCPGGGMVIDEIDTCITISTTYHFDHLPSRWRLVISTAHHFDDSPLRQLGLSTTHPYFGQWSFPAKLTFDDDSPLQRTNMGRRTMFRRRNIFDPVPAPYLSSAFCFCWCRSLGNAFLLGSICVLVHSVINIPFIVLATTSHMIMLTVVRMKTRDENGLPQGLKLTNFRAEKTTERHCKAGYKLSRDLNNWV